MAEMVEGVTPVNRSMWWRVPEAAEQLQVSEHAIYQAIRAGQLPVIHVGTQPRISPIALLAWSIELVRDARVPAWRPPVAEVAAASTAAPTPVVPDRRQPRRIGTRRDRKAGS